MKKLFLSLVALMVAAMSYAQGSLLATLSHAGKITTYYGAQALSEAHAAAANGDVITLSSGTFNSIDITKAVTIRGAGMEVDSVSGVLPTIITGDFNINISNPGNYKLTLEGIYHNHKLSYYNNPITNPMFLKCRLGEITGNSGNLINASFIHCKISKRFLLAGSCSASCVNCVIVDPQSSSWESSNFEIANCILIISTGDIGWIYSSSIRNSILYDTNTAHWVHESTTTFNNIAFTNGTFKMSPNKTNKIVSKLSDVFKSFTGTYNDNESFELKDTAKKNYLGTDGKEVGIYGGSLPFDPIPSNPQITKCNVAAKSTADGKLSVDIEVNGAK